MAASSQCAIPGAGRTVVRHLIKRDGRWVVRTLDGRCPERTVDTGNETHIQSAVVLVGNMVCSP